jgi:predicted nucleic acid-binding protein
MILLDTNVLGRLTDSRDPLVAAMQTHGISRLLTFNVNDFKPFAITIIDPNHVISPASP